MVSPQDTAYAHCLKWLLLVLCCTGNTWSLKVWSAGLRAGEKFPLTCSIPTLKYLPHWQATGNPITLSCSVSSQTTFSHCHPPDCISCMRWPSVSSNHPSVTDEVWSWLFFLCSAYFFDSMPSSTSHHPWIVATQLGAPSETNATLE